MRKNKGTVLALATSTFLIFTLVGLGTMYFAGIQSGSGQTRVGSAEAFWIAEAGVQTATVRLPEDPTDFSGSLGAGTYAVDIEPISTVRWRITSVGNVPSQTREIEAVFGPDISTAIKVKGLLTISGNAEVNGPTEELADFTFEDIFGISQAQMESQATHSYTDPDNNPEVSNITYIKFDKNKKCSIESGWSGSGVLIVEGGDLIMTGGAQFNGIIWVSGGIIHTLGGNTVVNGTIFVDCGENETTKVVGTTEVNLDFAAIDAAFADNDIPGTLKIVFWEEK